MSGNSHSETDAVESVPSFFDLTVIPNGSSGADSASAMFNRPLPIPGEAGVGTQNCKITHPQPLVVQIKSALLPPPVTVHFAQYHVYREFAQAVGGIISHYGWALKNRAALMPSSEQVKRAAATVEELRRRHHGKIVIGAVVPDYYARLIIGATKRSPFIIDPAGVRNYESGSDSGLTLGRHSDGHKLEG
jgi:hypothetical protein